MLEVTVKVWGIMGPSFPPLLLTTFLNNNKSLSVKLQAY